MEPHFITAGNLREGDVIESPGGYIDRVSSVADITLADGSTEAIWVRLNDDTMSSLWSPGFKVKLIARE